MAAVDEARDVEQKKPGPREWTGYWSMIGQQTQNAFNDKAAQFLLIPLGGWLMGKASKVELAAGILISLPFVLFAPLAGWLSDRFSKRNVMIGSAMAQAAILALLCLAIQGKNFSLALAGFFGLAMQSAFISPAKLGLIKELVCSRHLGYASGIQQMTAMLAILSGQILSGFVFDSRLERSNDGWQAAYGPLLVITLLSLPAIGLAWLIPRTPSGSAEPLSAGLAVRHFRQLGDLWRDRILRRTSFGIAFFWGFAGFINLWSITLAKELTGGGAGFGSMSSKFMIAASLGMAGGFGVASLLMKRRIELGWVPLAGVAMTACTLLLAIPHPAGTAFLVLLALTAFSAAIFLTPLNAYFQDRCPGGQRGELLAAANLQDCMAGVIAVAVLFLAGAARSALGDPWWLGLHSQLLLAAVACGLITIYIARLLPADLVRVVGLALLRLFYRIRTAGEQDFPAKGGVLLLPNHITWADAFFLTAACPRPIRFVMDQGFMGSAAIRVFSQLFETVPISSAKPREALRASAEALKEGQVVCLFPEGQLTRTGTLRELKRGFELIARQAGCPMVPAWTDGAWGSIFSFEGNRFFTKIPHRLRYGITVGFGKPVAPEGADPGRIRAAMLEASALALDARLDTSGRGSGRAARANAMQLAQVNALPRRGDFGTLEGDSLPDSLPGLAEFSRLYRSFRRASATADATRDIHWLGGELLRKHLEESAPGSTTGVFYDFSERAAELLDRPDWIHCPCLAINGIIVAMSMPDPPQPHEGSKPQAGRKPGALGILLPGFSAAEEAGGWTVRGPAAPAGIKLPPGYRLDEEGFIVGTT